MPQIDEKKLCTLRQKNRMRLDKEWAISSIKKRQESMQMITQVAFDKSLTLFTSKETFK